MITSCMHEGCGGPALTCIPDDPNEPHQFYCPEHAPEHGFCQRCGTIWGIAIRPPKSLHS
jgi:hypothetical protein